MPSGPSQVPTEHAFDPATDSYMAGDVLICLLGYPQLIHVPGLHRQLLNGGDRTDGSHRHTPPGLDRKWVPFRSECMFIRRHPTYLESSTNQHVSNKG